MGKTILIVLLLLTANAFAVDLHVPTSRYPTIQAAINDANDGDTVIVAPGTHTRHRKSQLEIIFNKSLEHLIAHSLSALANLRRTVPVKTVLAIHIAI